MNEFTKKHQQAPQKSTIAFVTTSGVTQWLFLRGQMLYLQRRGLNPVAISAGDEYLQKMREIGIPTAAIPVSRSRIAIFETIIGVLALYRALRRLRPDVIHASTPKAAFLAMLAGACLRVQTRIFLMRGTITPRVPALLRPATRWLESMTARLATDVICVSNSLLAFARDKKILRRDEGHVLNHGMSTGIDYERFRQAGVQRATVDGRLRLGYVGRIARDKGIEELLAVWTKVKRVIPNASLTIVGPLDAADPVPNDCLRELESDPDVMFIGPVDDVAHWYGSIDLLLLLTRGSEGFPNAPMEAAASGIPCIATAVIGSVDAVVDGVTGYLVAPFDVSSTVEKIERYSSNISLLRQHGRNAQERVQNDFQQEQVWESFYLYLRGTEARSDNTEHLQ